MPLKLWHFFLRKKSNLVGRQKMSDSVKRKYNFKAI